MRSPWHGPHQFGTYPPPHLAAFQSYTIPPLCRSFINVYLTGNADLIDVEKTHALYVRPFFAECSKDVPQVSAHAVVDPRKKVMVVEIINAWPNPIDIRVDTPVALVDSINPDIRNVDVPPPTKDWESWNGLNTEVNDEVGLGGIERNDTGPPTCHTSAFAEVPANSFPPSANEIPPDDVPQTLPKKPPDVEMENVEEFPEDEAQPMCSINPEDEGETILQPVVDDPPPEDPPTAPPDDESCRNLKFNKEGCIFEGENMTRFDDLCDKYDMIFSKTEGDLGNTGLFYHGIELTHQNPVYAPNYKAPPPQIQKAIDRETDSYSQRHHP